MKGGCDCGAVTLDIPGVPDRVNACPCGFCSKAGALWGYFPRDSVTVTGRTQLYRRASRRLEIHRCEECGILTHWLEPTGRWHETGVNMRCFDPDTVAAIEVVVDP
jgi:hypothetical protein